MTYYTQAKTSKVYIARLDFLDGIRGWASFAVLLHHILICFFVVTTPFLNYDRERLMEDIFTSNYLSILYGILLRCITNGHLAVIIFFVLSGYALSVGHLDLEKRKLSLSTVSRYFRLMIPILITSLIAYVLLKFNLMFNLEVTKINEEFSGWLGNFYNFDASINDVIIFSLFNVFFNYDIDKSYNSNLWTIPIEIIGSLMIYAYLGIFKTKDKINWKILLPLTIIL